jgi:hypothetical protein
VCPRRFQPQNAFDDVDRQIEPVHLVQNSQPERSADATASGISAIS